LLAAGGADRSINLWEIGREHEPATLRPFPESSEWIWSLAFNPDGRLLASGHTNGQVELWDVEKRQHLRSMQHGFRPVGALRFGTDGKSLITSGNGDVLKRWDVDSGECIRTVAADNLGNWVKAVAIGRDGGLLTTGADDQSVKLWHIDSDEGYRVQSLSEHAGRVWAVAMSADGDMFASSDDEGTTILWDIQAGVALRRLTPDRPYERMNIVGIKGINAAQRAALKALGAVEHEESRIGPRAVETDHSAAADLVVLDASEIAERRARKVL
jgi:WD40 repeat protein